MNDPIFSNSYPKNISFNNASTETSLSTSGAEDLKISNTLAYRLKSILGKIWDNTFSRGLVVDMFLGPEYMARGISGESGEYALKKVIRLLERMEPKSENTNHLIKSLEYAKRIESKKMYPNISLAKQVEKDVYTLKVGEGLAIPSSTLDHAMILSITCTSEENGIKSFKVVHHNTGMSHNSHKIATRGKNLKVLTALQIENISGKKLNKKFFQSLLNIDSVQGYMRGGSYHKLYDEILSRLGEFSDIGKDQENFWNRPQLGGSCTVKCLLSFLKVEMPAVEYRAFRNFTKYEIIKKSVERIEKGWGNSKIRKVLTLESVQNLHRNLDKIKKERNKNTEVDSEKIEEQLKELNRIKSRLKKDLFDVGIKKTEETIKNKSKLNGIKVSLSVDHENRIYSKSRLDNLNLALYLLKNYNYSSEFLERANHFIEQALTLIPSEIKSEKESHEEITNLLKLASQLEKYQNRKLTRDEIYLLAGISSGIVKALNEYGSRVPQKKMENVLQIYKDYKIRFRLLGIRKIYRNKIINRAILGTSKKTQT